MALLLTEFEAYPSEKALIGDMLMAYGEMEFELSRLLSPALDHNDATALKVMFRTKGESARVEVTDGILRPFYEKTKLVPTWELAYGAVKHCKNIRNQYAHCHWFKVDDLPLCFMNLDADASNRDNSGKILLYPVTLSLLNRQYEYFHYTLDILYYLDDEYKTRAGLQPTHARLMPKSIPAPPLHIRKEMLAQKSDEQTSV